MRPPPPPAFALLLVTFAACSGDSSAPPTSQVKNRELRVAGAQTGGEGAALAGALLLSAGMPVPLDGRAGIVIANPALADEMAFRALNHLECASLGAGSGAAANALGGERIRRLAKEATAPPDTSGNGTNLDEVWQLEVARLSASAGAPPRSISYPALLPWALGGSAELAASVAGKTREQIDAWRTVGTSDQSVDLTEVAEAMLGGTLAGVRLLSENRGSWIGPDPERGQLGALLLEQAVALEETLVASLFFDGTVLGRLNSPATYDPEQGLRWVPASVRVALDDKIAGAPGYTVVDRGSSLETLAALLEAEAQLAWIGGVENPYPGLRDLLNGAPFGERPAPRRPRPIEPIAANSVSAAEVTYQADVAPLFAKYACTACHYSVSPLFGNFDARTYEAILRGGTHQATNPSVIPGNSQASLLWRVLAGPVPALSIRKMPQDGPYYLSSGELSIVADWIDGGAKKEPSVPVPPPRIGQDLALALRKNLDAMHFEPNSGALFDRHEGDAPARYAASSSTGRALSALSLYLHALPSDTEAREILLRASGFVLEALTDAAGEAVSGVDLDLGTPGAPADLFERARLVAGLVAAGRVLEDAEVLGRARALGTVLLSPTWWDPELGLFRTSLAHTGRRYTPRILAAVLSALRELAADGGVPGAGAAHDRLLETLRPLLAYSEWGGNGEVLNDGVADTDGNAVPEPGSAGGTFGLAPLLVGAILEGDDPQLEPGTAPITWSKDIAPLFRSVCAECHLGGAVRGNYRLDTPLLVRTPGDSGGVWPMVVPGDPSSSLLYHMVTTRNPVYGHQMPLQKPPLDDRGKELIRRWILEGATGR